MRVAGVPVGPRRLAAAACLTAGLVGLTLGAAQLSTVAALAVVAAVAGLCLLATVASQVRMRRHQRPTAEPERSRIEQAQRAQLGQLSEAVRGLRESVDTRLELVMRSQRRSEGMLLWQRAEQRRQRVGAPARAGREREVAAIEKSDLFDPEWYQGQIGMRVADPAGHYVDAGACAGVDPHPRFPSARYLELHPDALLSWRTPLGHYLAAEGDPATGWDPPVVRRDRLGRPDEDDLKWEYLVRGLHREPDTFVLYRIIGNDLPPRHRPGQALDNLRFILEHEPELPDCAKRWVVNRIVDRETEQQVIALLEARGMPYLHIPFEDAAYRRVGWRFTQFPLPGFGYRPEFDALSPLDRQRALDHVYHDKNRYVMNNNGARNAALRQGRALAKWVLPWDGNCFLTRQAWDQIVAAVTAQPYLKYFTTPMARILDNDILLRPDPPVSAGEEPQLIFRRDAREEFDEDARYGRCPKVELFGRLGIAGPWEGWCRGPWDKRRAEPSPEAGQYGQAGWVARLYSGQGRLEQHIEERGWKRIAAVRERIDRIDERLASQTADAATLSLLDEQQLARQRRRWEGADVDLRAVVTQLVRQADSVVGRRTGPADAAIERALMLVLAGYFTRERHHLAGGAALVRARFLARGTRLDPRGWHGHHLHYLPDVARLLEREEALTASQVRRLRDWCAAHRTWLQTSDQGRQRRAGLDHTGTWYDVVTVAVDVYLGDLRGLLDTLRRGHERVGQQFEPDGRQLLGVDHAIGPRDCAYNLRGWVSLARFAGRVGQDLWAYRSPDGRGLEPVVRRALADSALDPDHATVLAHEAAGLARDRSLTDGLADPYQVRQVYPPADGIRPFWVLGMSPVPAASGDGHER